MKKTSKRIVIIVVLAIIAIVITMFVSRILRGSLFETFDNSTITLNTDEIVGNKFNLLFIGVDNGGRADTVMLFEIEDSDINCISIPRNTIMENKRISDIFATENGNQAVIDSIKKNLSVPVHYYTEMNLSALKEIVDNVGGMDFDVPMDMNYDDPYQDLHINLKKGTQHLNGETVCELLQFRKDYTDGDLSRIQLHQQFLDEFIQQKLSKENIDKIPEIIDIISNNIKTNYSMNNFRKDIKIIKSIDNIKFETIPGKITVYENMPVYEIK